MKDGEFHWPTIRAWCSRHWRLLAAGFIILVIVGALLPDPEQNHVSGQAKTTVPATDSQPSPNAPFDEEGAAFRRWVRTNFKGSPKIRRLIGAETSGLRTLKITIDVGEDSDIVEPAKTACAWFLTWLERSRAKAEVFGNTGRKVTDCEYGKPTVVTPGY